MSRINTNPTNLANLNAILAQQNARAQQTTLPQPANQPASRADTVSTAARGLPALLDRIGTLEHRGVRFRTLNTALESINTSLRDAIDTVASAPTQTADISDARERIDSVLASIDSILERGETFAGTINDRLTDGPTPRPTVSNRSDGVAGPVRVTGELPGGADALDVDIEVTQSAQQGALLLSFGAGHLNLSAASATFVIVIEGSIGSRELSFASGTALSDIRDTINAFTDQTGVSAAVSGPNAVRIDANRLGDDDFVSVRVLDDAGQPGGVQERAQTNVNWATGASTAYTALDFTGDAITDFGQDVGVLYNGAEQQTDGARVFLDGGTFNAQFDLVTRFAQTEFAFNVFTLNAPTPQAAPPAPTAELRETLLAINPAAATEKDLGALTRLLDSLTTQLNDLEESSVNAPLREYLAQLREQNTQPTPNEASPEQAERFDASRAESIARLLRGSQSGG